MRHHVSHSGHFLPTKVSTDRVIDALRLPLSSQPWKRIDNNNV